MISSEWLTSRQSDLFPWVVFLLAVVSAFLIGVLAVVDPVLASGSVGLIAIVLVYSLGQRLVSIYLVSLAVVLTGYMFLGRGFAHLGLPPVYVGEFLLLTTLIAISVSLKRVWFGVTSTIIVLFMLLGLSRTLPYVSWYGLDAIRDAVVWGYAIFALAAAWLVKSHHFERVIYWYQRILPFFIVWVPIALLTRWLGDTPPTWPWSHAPVFDIKAGDMGVHLAAAGAFLMLSSHEFAQRMRPGAELLIWLIWFIGVAVVSSLNRGGMLAISLGIATAMSIRPNRRVLTMVLAAVIAVGAIGITNPTVEFGGHRQLSMNQLAANVQSIVMDSGEHRLHGTTEWRMSWWNDIVNYTLHGPYFWTGKGFGINLANDDGYQVHMVTQTLRSPHNGHLTILARMGVPGAALWILLNASFAAMMLNALIRAYRNSNMFWVQIVGWLFVYWLAILVNSTFDVYLEGPQGGIWFWTVVGLGVAACRIQSLQYSDRDDSEQLLFDEQGGTSSTETATQSRVRSG